MKYNEFVKTTDVTDKNDTQFYLDGMSEEHGEIFGIIKRIRRGDYDNLGVGINDLSPSNMVNIMGLSAVVQNFYIIKDDLIKEIGDHHWYETRLLQIFGMTWDEVEKINMEKLEKRKKQNKIMGKGSNR